MTPIEIPVVGKIKRPSRWVIGLVATTLLVVGSTGTYNLVMKGTNKQDISKLTVPVDIKDATLKISVSGKIVPIQTVNISPKNPSILEKIYVKQGDKVEQGQIIARMDSKSVQAQILQSQANLEQVKAQLDQAKTGSRVEEISQARARLAASEAQLAQALAGNRPQEIDQIQAQFEAAQSKLNYSNQQVKRYQFLAQQGAVKKQELDQVVSEANVARANATEAQRRLSLMQSGSRVEDITQKRAAVAETKAALELLQKGSRPEEIAQRQAGVAAAAAQLQSSQVQLEDTIIRAPFSGIITQRYATEGAYVSPAISASNDASATSTAIVALAEGLEVLAKVPEVDIGQIKLKQQVEIILDAYPDEVFKGSVRLIAPEAVVEDRVTFFQVRITLNTGKDKLLSGLNVRSVTFLGDSIKQAILVPQESIVTKEGKTGVMIPDENNKPQFRPVTIGSTVENQIQVLDGLKAGERVFIDLPEEPKK
jgi:HlyD family secretion protein